MKTIEGDLLDIKKGIICHQVNTCGVYASGLAKQIRDKYPIAYDCYMYKYNTSGWQLGNVQLVKIDDSLKVANIAGQASYGKTGIHTDYNALREAFKKIAEKTAEDVYVPENIGCGLGGGDWSIVLKILEEELPRATIVSRQTTLRTIIAGSREASKEQVMEGINLCPWKAQISLVVSGGARGADSYGEEWASEFGVKIQTYPANWDTHPSTFYKR